MPISHWELTSRAKRDYKRLDAALQERVDEVLRMLVPWPTAGALRHHTLSGYRPPIHVVDVTVNRSHQLSFTVEGTVARVLRVSTHREIDRSPD
jgi:ABC-type protease/lipase transport system fused ATPase/permease subunit